MTNMLYLAATLFYVEDRGSNTERAGQLPTLVIDQDDRSMSPVD
ncbi:hypothetical protein [Bradyrhizobium monzae]|nr:hypothetical protein [Bradyrhizobium sp. Oc8]